MNLFIILAWVVFGAMAGWIASIITNKNRQMGALANIVTGIAGAFIGAFIMQTFFGRAGFTGFDLYSFFMAIGGAVILIWLVGLISGGRRRR